MDGKSWKNNYKELMTKKSKFKYLSYPSVFIGYPRLFLLPAMVLGRAVSFFLGFLRAMLIILFSAALGFSATYYVDPGGNNSNSGTTLGQAWLTIQKAANTVTAGSTILISSGTYNEQVTITCAGTAINPIVFKGATSGNPPVIDGQNTRLWCIYVDGTSSPGDKYITVENIKMQNGFTGALKIGMADHVTIRSCIALNSGEYNFFTAYAWYPLFENCQTYGAVNQHGIYFSNSNKYPTARGNIIYNNGGCGIHNNGDVSMTGRAGADGINHNGLIEKNIIYNNSTKGGAAINMDGCRDYVVKNNLLYNNKAGGITSFITDGASSGNNKFYNNIVIFENAVGRSGINLQSSPGNTVSNNIFINGISTNRGCLEYDAASLVGLTFSNNTLYQQNSSSNVIFNGSSMSTLTAWQTATGKGAGCLFALPSFVNSAAGDYHSTVSSIVIGTGLTLSEVTDDLDGNLRPSSGYDTGCYQYGSSTTPITTAATANPLNQILVYPNPYDSRISDSFKLIKIPSNVNVKVINAAGGLLREYSNVSGTLSWDGKDSSNTQVSRGIYYIVMEDVASNKRVIKMALLK